MKIPTRFLLYVLTLNVVRYLVGMPLELATVGSRMEGVMALFPDSFNADFGANDFAISLIYNFVMWFAVILVFHLSHPVFSGPMIWRSLKVFGLMLLLYLSLSAVLMNHFRDDLKPFFLYAMLDGVILFLLLGLANGVLYRFFFKPRTAHFDEPGNVPKTVPVAAPRLRLSREKSRGQETLSETGTLPTSNPASYPSPPGQASKSSPRTDPKDE